MRASSSDRRSREIGLVGTSHRLRPLADLEPFHIDPALRAPRLLELRDHLQVEELVYLATCNRVEWIYAAREGVRPHDVLQRILEHLAPEGREDARTGYGFYTHTGSDAAAHLFRVASSLDSMLIGEAQILGQVKDAFQQASEHGLVGTEMNLLFEAAFRTAKRVRSETALAAKPVSLASLASDVFRAHFGAPPSPIRIRACIVGIGPMSGKAARYLAARGDVDLLFVNRTRSGAEALAADVGGRAASLAEFLAAPEPVDLLVTSTGSPEPLFDARALAPSFDRPGTRRPLLLDLAVPRDLHPSLDRDSRVVVVRLDDLRARAERNRASRAGEVEKALPIVRAQVAAYETKRAARLTRLSGPDPEVGLTKNSAR